jgi:predicted ATPase
MPLLQREIWAFPPAPYKPLIFDFLRWAPPGEYEEPLLGLRFRVERPGRIVGVVHKGEEIPPSLVASGSAQFAAVVMAASSPGVASLIIEEPELNLHVDAQLKAAEYLASLSHRLFITTRSDLFAIALVHHLKRRGRLSEVKIYELVKGEASEVPIDERGAVGEFKTITPIELKAVEQFLEDLA